MAHHHAPSSSCGHRHAHGPAHAQAGRASATIAFAFALNFGFSLLEMGGGLWIGSMAILAGAMHDLGDSASLAAAWGLERYSRRAPDKQFNFGYRRFSLLSALVTGAIVIGGSAAIAIEAVDRLRAPSLAASEASGWVMVGLAAAGLAVNGLAAFRLSLGRSQSERVLTWHLLEDVFNWAIVLIGAVSIALTGEAWIDAALAIALAAFVAFNVVRHLRHTLFLFLQGRPANFDEDGFVREALQVPRVAGVDEIRAWSLDGESFVLAMRLSLQANSLAEAEEAKSKVRELAVAAGADRDSVAIETVPCGPVRSNKSLE